MPVTATAAALLMTALAAAALGSSPPAATNDARVYTLLSSGRYAIKISGMLTTTCGRTIETELLKLADVEAAKVDFDKEQLVLTVKLNRKVKVSALRRALHKASKRVDLGSEYLLGAVLYIP